MPSTRRGSSIYCGTPRKLQHMKLDTLDLRILAELQADGSLSNVELARRVHLSPSPCLRRVRILERAGIIARYVAVLDQDGVGKLVQRATVGGRKTRPKLKVGICGEHGGEPSSVEFCHQIGLNYVSCSPFRVPIARLAAAQAALAPAVRDR